MGVTLPHGSDLHTLGQWLVRVCGVFRWLLLFAPIEFVIKMIPEKAPGGDVLHASGDLKKEAHIPSFEKYKELYIKSVECPEGEFRVLDRC